MSKPKVRVIANICGKRVDEILEGWATIELATRIMDLAMSGCKVVMYRNKKSLIIIECQDKKRNDYR